MTTSRSSSIVAKPRSRWFRLVGAVAVAFLVSGAVLVLRARAFDGAVPPPLTDSLALPVMLPDGRKVSLRELVRPGRPTVINLWASWCGPCRLEAPTIVQLHRRFGARINLIYLNVRDESASRTDLSTYMAGVGLPSDAYARLASDRVSSLTGAGNDLVPRTMVFDREGAPQAMITGYKPLALARVESMVTS